MTPLEQRMNYLPMHKENLRLRRGGQTMAKIGDVIVWYPGGPAIMADGPIWLPCDGRLVSRKAYPSLYALIGQTYADEDKRCCNAELFPLPDLTDRSSLKSSGEWKPDGE